MTQSQIARESPLSFFLLGTKDAHGKFHGNPSNIFSVDKWLTKSSCLDLKYLFLSVVFWNDDWRHFVLDAALLLRSLTQTDPSWKSLLSYLKMKRRKSWEELQICYRASGCTFWKVTAFSRLNTGSGRLIIYSCKRFGFSMHMFTPDSTNCRHFHSPSLVNTEVLLMIYRSHMADVSTLSCLNYKAQHRVVFESTPTSKFTTRLINNHFTLYDTDLTDVSEGVSRGGRLKWAKVFIN